VGPWVVVFEGETKNGAHQHHKVQAQDDWPVAAQGGDMAARQEKLRAQGEGPTPIYMAGSPKPSPRKNRRKSETKAEQKRDEAAGQKMAALSVRGGQWRSVVIHNDPCG